MDVPKFYIYEWSSFSPGLEERHPFFSRERRTEAGPRLAGRGMVLGGVATAVRGRGVSGGVASLPASLPFRAHCASGPHGGAAGSLRSTSRRASEWATALLPRPAPRRRAAAPRAGRPQVSRRSPLRPPAGVEEPGAGWVAGPRSLRGVPREARPLR